LAFTIVVVATRQSAGTRAKDSDRNDTCQVLDTALSEGQLSMEEHRQRVSVATNATTLGDLHALVSDLQTTKAPVQLPRLKSPSPIKTGGWGMRIAVAVILVLLGVGIGWGLYGNTSSPLSFTADPGAKADGIAPVVVTPPKQLHSLGGLTGLFEQMRQRFGDTMGYRLLIYPDYASLYRPDPQDDRRQFDYNYRGGWGDPTVTPKNDGDRLVDVSKFNFEVIVGLMRGAPATVGIKPADVENTYLIVDPSGDSETPDAVTVSIHVSSDFGGGSMQVAPDGRVKQITPLS
jgi:Domain of unknown function (DUF1707)